MTALDDRYMPLVSVITPVYNRSLFLDRTVQSVVAQTFKDWEMLLIDDGSSDDSYQMMLRWAEKDDRIKVLHHPGHVNRGISATRNLGIGQARGEYIAFLDSDDLWRPERRKVMRSMCAFLMDARPQLAHRVLFPVLVTLLLIRRAGRLMHKVSTGAVSPLGMQKL